MLSTNMYDVDIRLPDGTNFQLNSQDNPVRCTAGAIYYYDEHGHKLKLLANSCEESMKVISDEESHHYLGVSCDCNQPFYPFH